MKNTPKPSLFTERCVLYVRENKQILKEGSYFYLDSMRQLNQINPRKVNIVSKSFFENVLTKG